MTDEELAELLCGLPWGEGGVPKPLAGVLVPPRTRQRLIAGEPPGRLEFPLLAALGISGWSARLDLVQALNGDRGLQPRSGSYRRAVGRLDESGLWVTHIASFGYRKIALVRLLERGAGLLQEAGVAAVAVMTTEDQYFDPHFKERESYIEIEHPLVGVEALYGIPWRLSETPGAIYRPAPSLGEHNDYVFKGLLGLNEKEMDRLVKEKVTY